MCNREEMELGNRLIHPLKFLGALHPVQPSEALAGPLAHEACRSFLLHGAWCGPRSVGRRHLAGLQCPGTVLVETRTAVT